LATTPFRRAISLCGNLPNCWREHVNVGAINPRGGRIAIPQGPGLGVDPDPAALRRLALDA